MKESNDFDDLFDRAYRNELSQKELGLFESKLREDESFRNDYGEHIEKIRLVKTMGIKAEMRHLMESQKNPKSNRAKYLLPIGIAATISIFFIFWPQSTNNQDLFEQNFKPFPDVLTGRADQVTINLSSYNNADYLLAISSLQKLSQSDTTAFYTGVSHLALRQAKPSISEFRKIYDQSAFFSASQWYLALGHLLDNDIDSAKYYLKLVPLNSTYSTNAEELYELLE